MSNFFSLRSFFIIPYRKNDTNLKKKLLYSSKTVVGTFCATCIVYGYPWFIMVFFSQTVSIFWIYSMSVLCGSQLCVVGELRLRIVCTANVIKRSINSSELISSSVVLL